MALIQSSAVGNSTGGASLTVTLTNVVQGSLLTLEVAFAQQTNGNAPTTPPGWTVAQNPAGQIITLGIAWSGSCIYYKENATAGTHNAVIVPGGSVAVMSAVASEWVSGLTSGALDKSTNAANAAGTTGGSGTTAATANAGELVIAAYGFLDNTGTPHANCGVSSPATTGYTALGVNQDNTTTGTAFQASYKYVTSTGTQVAAWTYTDASAGVGTIATFKLAPRIDTQPINKTANVGGTATFNIAATTSNGTLSYQWKVNGSNVGTDSTSYTTGTLTNSNQWDQITCVVTDTNGSTTSSAATLFVAFAAAGTGLQRRNPVGAFPVGTLRWKGIVSSSGVTGSLAYTNANDTLAANGTTTVTGSLTKTNANDTLVAAGTTTVTGTLAKTNANDTSAASGTTTITGTLARTNADDSVSASGTVGGGSISGTLAYTNANDTSTASGTTTITGSLAKTNANDTSAATGTTTITGTLARTNANDTSAASGTTTITGALSTTNNDDSVVASGSVGGSITGTVNYTNNDDTVVATGTVTNNNIPMGGAGHPSGIYWGVRHHKKFTKDLNWLLDRVVSEYYGELTDPEMPIAVQKEAAKIVRPYSKDGLKIPESVNWAKLEQDADRLIQLLQLYQNQKETNDQGEEEMLWMMMH